MFDRFLRHIHERHASVATFDAAQIETFFNEIDSRTTPGTSTRLRYAKMLNRICRHLVDIGCVPATRRLRSARSLVGPTTSRYPFTSIRPQTNGYRRGLPRQGWMTLEYFEIAPS